MCRLTARVHGNPRPLTTVKDAAYAARQMVFYLSLCAPAEQRRVIGELATKTARCPGHVGSRLAPALAGLQCLADGGALDADGTTDRGRARRFLGWTTDGSHWLCQAPATVLHGHRP
ncbi:hypothetical protein ADL21_02800 [Streptomyces albus subsp. albus]|nr:hypothetical protein ADL21_02800 [Streptomyces albus subsp. albus]